MIAALVVLFVAGVLLFVAAAVAIAAVAIAFKLLPFIFVGWLVMRLVRSGGRTSYPIVRASHRPHGFPRPAQTGGGISVEDAAWLDSRP